MSKLFLLALLALLPLTSSVPISLSSSSTADDYSGCTGTTVTVAVSDKNVNVLNYTFIFSTADFGYGILLSDFKYSSINSSMYRPSDLQKATTSIDFQPPQSCTAGNCQYFVGNGTVSIKVPLIINGSTIFYNVLNNTVDSTVISDQSGSMFLGGKPSVITTYMTSPVKITVNQTCVKYTKVTKPYLTSTPMCTRFNASIQFLKSPGPQIADITVDLMYNQAKGTYSIKTTDSGVDTIQYYDITMNGFNDYSCVGVPGTTVTCQKSIGSSLTSFKSLFQMFVNTDNGRFTAIMGRFMVRNNIPLKEDGDIYTSRFPCETMYYYGTVNGATVTAVSKFCCSSFA